MNKLQLQLEIVLLELLQEELLLEQLFYLLLLQ